MKFAVTHMLKPGRLKTAMATVHWMVLASVYSFFLVKATFQFSRPADLLAFHLPRALQYFGLTTYQFGEWAERQAAGFPGLPNFIQGFLVALTGQINSVNTINLIGFGAAVLGILFLFRRTFPMRWFLTYCLAIPLFYYHITIGFIDLFASSMVLLAFAGLHSLNINQKPFWSAIFVILGCTLAMFSKMTVWPAAVTIAAFALSALFLHWHSPHLKKIQIILLTALLIAGVSYFPLRNLVLFGNPTHPIELKLYMKTLPAVAVVSQVEEVNIPSSLVTKSQSLEFFYSIMEMNRGSNIPLSWAAFQEHGRPFERDNMGGFFFLTMIVLFSMVLVYYVSYPINGLTFSAFVTCVGVAANLPHSSVLRYCLYLPLMGFFLLCAYSSVQTKPVRRITHFGFILCIAFVVPYLGDTFWMIDLRPHSSFAPTAAQNFWQDHEKSTFDDFLIIQGAYPSTIYWSGPDFNRWKIREELDNRYVNTIREVIEK